MEEVQAFQWVVKTLKNKMEVYVIQHVMMNTMEKVIITIIVKNWVQFFNSFYGIGPVCWQTCGGTHPFTCAGVFCAVDEVDCNSYLTKISASVITLGLSRPFKVK